MTTNQEDRQAFFRAGAGVTSGTYNENLMQNAQTDSITNTNINGAFAEWLQNRTNTSKTNINDLKAEFASLHGASNWESVGGSPLLLRGLQLWLDAADTSTITESSNLVSQWDDKSGNSKNATGTGDARPTTNASTISNKNVLTFNGTSDVLATTQNWPLEGNIFIVCKPTAIATSVVHRRIISSTAPPGVTDGEYIVDYAESGGSYRLRFLTSGANIIGTTTFELGDTILIEARFSASANTTEVLLNGVSQGTDGNTNTAENLPIYIGEDTDGGAGNEFFGGDIAEMDIYDRVLTTGEIAAVETYLNNKWGL